MKRFCFLAALTLFSPSAYARERVSFVVAGHRIHIEASRSCRSPSCASISISGIYDSRRKQERLDDDRDAAPPMKAPETVASVAVAPPASNPVVQPVAPAAPPPVFKPAAVATQQVVLPPPQIQPTSIIAPPPPPPPQTQPARIAPPPPPLPAAPPIDKPAEAARPAPPVSRVPEEDRADTPIGDWQTEGKGAVRIAPCGGGLCGYVLNSSSDDKGEAVLINMKPKGNSKWVGNVYSHDSGDTYYGTMEMTGPYMLRIEACALGRFYCSGNVWGRIAARAERLISSRQSSQQPRS